MAKRFTETDLWKNQRWFRKLSPTHKLAFNYIKDVCNHGGLWRVDCADLIEDLGLEEFDISSFIKDVNTEYDSVSGKKISRERLKLVKKNYLWITGFIQFQYEGKDKRVPLTSPVRTALLFLKSLDILEESLSRGYVTLKQQLPEGWEAPKEKDKDKDNVLSLTKENKNNGKQFRSTKSQGADLYADLISRTDTSKNNDGGSEGAGCSSEGALSWADRKKALGGGY
jgi:hypothetical protein